MEILISGYYGFANEGDEMILESLLFQLAARRSQITVLSANPAATRCRHRVAAVSRWHPWVIWKALKRCRVLISGGGGLIQDATGPWTPAYYLGILAAAQWLKRSTCVLGQGFGPVTRRRNLDWARRVLGAVHCIMPRDAAGVRWCLEAGVPAERIFPGADLVWLRPSHPPKEGTDWVICLRGDHLAQAMPAWLPAVAAWAHAHQRRLRFVAMDPHDDLAWIEKFIGFFPGSTQVTPRSQGLPADAFSGAELVISMRYHGLVLGAQAGAAVLGWGSNPKLQHVLADLGQAMLRPEALDEQLEQLLPGMAQAGREAMAKAAELRVRARQASSKMQALLNRVLPV